MVSTLFGKCDDHRATHTCGATPNARTFFRGNISPRIGWNWSENVRNVIYSAKRKRETITFFPVCSSRAVRVGVGVCKLLFIFIRFVPTARHFRFQFCFTPPHAFHLLIFIKKRKESRQINLHCADGAVTTHVHAKEREDAVYAVHTTLGVCIRLTRWLGDSMSVWVCVCW